MGCVFSQGLVASTTLSCERDVDSEMGITGDELEIIGLLLNKLSVRRGDRFTYSANPI
jgi:hypothetical protein